MPAELSSSVANSTQMLQQWNQLEPQAAADEVLPCCGSKTWARVLAESRPMEDAEALLTRSEYIWQHLSPADWDEAFATHPRIGASDAPEAATALSGHWSRQEQSSVRWSSKELLQRLAQGNKEYEQRFGRTYIVCATGKSAAEMLAMLELRIANAPERELLEAVEQQRLITRLRLQKWLGL